MYVACEYNIARQSVNYIIKYRLFYNIHIVFIQENQSGSDFDELITEKNNYRECKVYELKYK